MKIIISITLLSIFSIPATAQLPSALVAKEKIDALNKAKIEQADLETKATLLENALQEAKKKVADAANKTDIAKKDYEKADAVFQKELADIKQAVDASYKLLDSKQEIKKKEEPQPVVPPEPKKEPSEPKKEAKDNIEVTFAPSPGDAKTGRLTVILNPSAKLWINDTPTKEAGGVRNFSSEGLAPGDYRFALKIVNPDGSIINREVSVRAGIRTTVTIGGK